ncbi:MAG: VLRF1 family aeRF1-type release factor [Actinomycetota bacterium]|nr:VLRF1 family aeRF1-type release factor [Actinomycetota bacterium]
MSLDEQTILDLINLRDGVGVLSVFVGITPERAAEPRPGWPIAIRNELRALRQRVKEEGPHERWVALSERVEKLEPELERLLDASRYGRGRALFATVVDDRVETVAIQIPFQDRVVFDRSAYIRPLVAVYDEARPAGIAVVYSRGVRLLEWRVGEAEELFHEVFTVGGRDWREHTGPAPAQPLDTRPGGHRRDRYQERVDENRNRFLREQAGAVADLANRRSWDRLIVAGDPRLTKSFSEELHPSPGEQLLVFDLSWEEEAPNNIAEAAWNQLKTLRRERERNLVEEAKNRALAGGTGALGLDDVLAALNEGRVERLLFDVDASFSGYRTPEGLLYATDQIPTVQETIEEPLLLERMIERAVTTSAKVTPLEGEGAEALRVHRGVAALLRW